MAIEITVPRLGWSMDEGTFAGWLKAKGDRVEKGDMVFSLEGDKAVEEIESFDAGTLHIPGDAPQPGDSVLVGQVVGFLLAEGESPPTTVGPKRAPPATKPAGRRLRGSKDTPPRLAGPAARRLAREIGVDWRNAPTPDPTGRVRTEDVRNATVSTTTLLPEVTGQTRVVASPRARRKARQLGIDWRGVAGTGRDGRVRERDVIATSAQTRSAPVPPSSPGQHKPASTVRQTIAHRMVAAIRQTAPVTIHTRVDASPLVAYRNTAKANGAQTVVPSYTDIIVYLVAGALRKCPELNACWHNNGIYVYSQINIGIAVDTDRGLLAPVLHDADQLDLQEISNRSRSFTEKAREGTLSSADQSGGTITVTNLGMLGVDAFTPIINLPQSAILGIGRIVAEPVVRDGQVVVGETLTLSLTFDHQVIDGAPAARWLQELAERIRCFGQGTEK